MTKEIPSSLIWIAESVEEYADNRAIPLLQALIYVEQRLLDKQQIEVEHISRIIKNYEDKYKEK